MEQNTLLKNKFIYINNVWSVDFKLFAVQLKNNLIYFLFFLSFHWSEETMVISIIDNYLFIWLFINEKHVIIGLEDVKNGIFLHCN